MSSDENDLIKAEAARYKRATEAATKSRLTLTELVIDALREPDAKPADIARRAEWTPAYVRKLARENGIEADPAYQARTQKARERLLSEAAAERDDLALPPDRRPAAHLPELATPPQGLEFSEAVRRLPKKHATILMKPVEREHPDWTLQQRARFDGVDLRWFFHALLQAAIDAGYAEIPGT